MSGPSPAPPPTRKVRWLALAFALALTVFTFLCWRDASRPPVRSVAGGSFVGKDVDGRLVYVHLFELDHADNQTTGWQGWLYREGQGQAEWFISKTRVHPWKETFHGRERDDFKSPPESTVASTAQAAHLIATLPRLASWGSDTANLARQFEHLSFRRLAGVRFGRVGGTQEYCAQFPRLPETNVFLAAVNREIIAHCQAGADGFNSEAFEFWKWMIRTRELPGFNQHELTANWQLRLLTTNLASFSVWSHDVNGGNGNHSHWHGANFIEEGGGVREFAVGELFREDSGWPAELRLRCVPKLKTISAPRPEAVFDKDVTLDVFTLSPTGLQIYFNPYAIASGADGEFVVHFDYAELKDLLRTDGPARLLPGSHSPAEK